MSHMVNGRTGNPKMRGVKRCGGQAVKAGGIIVRQKGMKFSPGTGVSCAKDFTLFAMTSGKVEFKPNRKVNVIADSK